MSGGSSLEHSTVKSHVKSNFPFKRPLSTDTLLEKSKNESLSGNVQFD